MRRSSERPEIIFDRPPDAQKIMAILADLVGQQNGADVTLVPVDRAG